MSVCLYLKAFKLAEQICTSKQKVENELIIIIRHLKEI